MTITAVRKIKIDAWRIKSEKMNQPPKCVYVFTKWLPYFMIFYDILWYSSNKRNKRVIISRRRINILAENPKSPKNPDKTKKNPEKWISHKKAHTSSRNDYPILWYFMVFSDILWYSSNKRNKRVIISRRRTNILEENPKSPKKSE